MSTITSFFFSKYVSKFTELDPEFLNLDRRVIWLGDLNYRINLSYEKTHELIAKREWSELAEKDQVSHES